MDLSSNTGGWYAVYRDFGSYVAKRVAFWLDGTGWVINNAGNKTERTSPAHLWNDHTPSVTFVTYDYFPRGKDEMFRFGEKDDKERWVRYRELEGLPVEVLEA